MARSMFPGLMGMPQLLQMGGGGGLGGMLDMAGAGGMPPGGLGGGMFPPAPPQPMPGFPSAFDPSGGFPSAPMPPNFQGTPESDTPIIDQFKSGFRDLSESGGLGAIGVGLMRGDFASGMENALALKQMAGNKNKTRAYIEKNYPDLAAALDNGADIKSVWAEALKRDGAEKKAPQVETFYGEDGNAYKAQWMGDKWEKVGGSKGDEGFEITTNPDGSTSIRQGPFGNQDAKNIANRVDAARDVAASGTTLKQLSTVLRKANEGMGYGGLTGSVLGAVDDELSQFGWGKGIAAGIPGDPGSRATMRSGGLEVALQQVQKTKGAISNAEMALFMAASPGMQNTPEGNAALLGMIDAIADRQIQRAQEMENWRAQNGGNLDGFEGAWAQYVEQNPLLIQSGGGVALAGSPGAGGIGGAAPSDPASFNTTRSGLKWRLNQ